MKKNHYRKFTLNSKEKKALDSVIDIFPDVIGVLLFGSRSSRFYGNDIDVMIIIERDANKKILQKVQERVEKYKKQNIVFQIFLISLKDTWQKMFDTDVQFITILNNSYIYKTGGFLKILQQLVDIELILPKANQISRLLDFSKSLMKENPTDLRDIYTSTCSNVQIYLLLQGIRPIMSPEQFPVYLKKTRIDPQYIDFFLELRELFLKPKQKSILPKNRLNKLYKTNLNFIDYVQTIIDKKRTSIR